MVKERDGRRNRYHIQEHLPLPEEPEQQRAIGEVLHLLTGHRERADQVGVRRPRERRRWAGAPSLSSGNRSSGACEMTALVRARRAAAHATEQGKRRRVSIRHLSLAVSEPDRTTRERILDVAFDLFVEQGFAGTTVTEIEKRAGLTGGSGGFYRHFRSKKALLRPAIEREVARYMTSIEEANTAQPDLDGLPKPREVWLEGMLDYLRLFDPLIRLMLTDGHRVPEVRDAVAGVLQALGKQMSWQQEPELTVCVIALGGYHLLSEVQGQPFQGLPQEEFIRMLATMTSEIREQRPDR